MSAPVQLLTAITRVMIVAGSAVGAGWAGWYVGWLILGLVFESGVHPDYYPNWLIDGAWVFAGATAIMVVLVAFRMKREDSRS